MKKYFYTLFIYFTHNCNLRIFEYRCIFAE